jgi:uncharacterized protein YcnI
MKLCAGLAVSLLFPAGAAAHVTVVPPALTQGIAVRVELDVPNERSTPMTGLVLETPGSILIDRGVAPAGWGVMAGERRARWQHGSLAPGQSERFPVFLTAEGRAGGATLVATQTYADGATVRWQANLTVLPGSGPSTPASYLGRGLLAGVVSFALLTASLAVLHRLRRRRQLRDG